MSNQVQSTARPTISTTLGYFEPRTKNQESDQFDQSVNQHHFISLSAKRQKERERERERKREEERERVEERERGRKRARERERVGAAGLWRPS